MGVLCAVPALHVPVPPAPPAAAAVVVVVPPPAVVVVVPVAVVVAPAVVVALPADEDELLSLPHAAATRASEAASENAIAMRRP
jgi:hypothetical protein